MSRIALPPLGMGTAPIGNLYAPVSEQEAEAAVQAALAGGITYFDTAPHYGQGMAERRLGAALGTAPAIVSSKVGRLLEASAGGGTCNGFVDGDPFKAHYDYSADGVRRSHDASLARLRRDRIEILLAHDLGPLTHGEQHPEHLRAFLDGGYPAMRALRDCGAVNAIGIGVNEIAICLNLLARVELDVILLAGRYTLLDRSAAERLIPECRRLGVTLVIGGPYNSGILAGGDLNGTRSLFYDYMPAAADRVAEAQRLAAICAEAAVPLPAAALQFPLTHPGVASVVAGLASVAEVEATIARSRFPIPESLWNTLAVREEHSPSIEGTRG